MRLLIRAVIVVSISVLLSLMVTGSVLAYNYAGYRWGGDHPWVPVDLSQNPLPFWDPVIQNAWTDWNNAGAKFDFYGGTSNNYIYVDYDPNGSLAWTNIYRRWIWWGNIVRCTTTINNYYDFYPPYTEHPYYDLESVMRHEFGHWLSLDHVPSRPPIMYPGFWSGEVRELDQDDIAGIRYIYGVE